MEWLVLVECLWVRVEWLVECLWVRVEWLVLVECLWVRVEWLVLVECLWVRVEWLVLVEYLWVRVEWLVLVECLWVRVEWLVLVECLWVRVEWLVLVECLWVRVEWLVLVECLWVRVEWLVLVECLWVRVEWLVLVECLWVRVEWLVECLWVRVEWLVECLWVRVEWLVLVECLWMEWLVLVECLWVRVEWLVECLWVRVEWLVLVECLWVRVEWLVLVECLWVRVEWLVLVECLWVRVEWLVLVECLWVRVEWLVYTELDEAEDLIEDMWLGVSVASQKQPAGPILICGHRFVKLYGAFKLRHMIGKCYLRGNDLQQYHDSMHWQNPNQVCSHRGDVSGEVMCNMGISADISQTEVLVGSPGSYVWQGNVHVSWENPEILYNPEQSSFPNMDKRHTYIGYSVALGTHLLSKEAVTIVTGAPRDDFRGSVFLADRRNRILVVNQSLHGEQMGSYYGNALAVTDLNNDGWSDLLVGAPFYFQPDQQQGGAVYVYMNQGGWLRLRRVLHGPWSSAFGMSLASAGDLNQDGYQDFAVGAPFFQTGSVYIWTGSSTGISQEPSQVIQGSQVSPGFRTFGFSLSGGLDVDHNFFPDLLVGSLDDTVALLRLQIKVCFSIVSRGIKKVKNITLHFTVIADITQHEPRLHFHENGHHVYSGVLTLATHPSYRCQDYTMGVVRPIQEHVSPVVLSLNASLVDPGLLLESPPHTHRKVHILKSCGSDHRCQSNLQMSAQFTNQELLPLRKQLAEDAYLTTLNINIPPSLRYAGVRSKGVVCTDGVGLRCELGDPFISSQETEIVLLLETQDEYLDKRESHTHLQLTTLSDQTPVSVSLALLLEFILETNFFLSSQPISSQFGGHVIGESAVRRTRDISSPLIFTLQVDVIGKPLGPLGHLQLEVSWPLESTGGKWLLYLMEINLDGSPEHRCATPRNIVNPLNLTIGNEIMR
ncbi:unnamed protein product [Arctogadus glacialis]